MKPKRWLLLRISGLDHIAKALKDGVLEKPAYKFKKAR